MLPQWRWKAALLALLASLFLLTSTPAAAEKPPPPEPEPVERITDDDDDGIFDDLEEDLEEAPPGQRFETIVLLDESLTPAALDDLEQRVGAFDVGPQFRSIDGFAATLTKAQITALAQLDVVQQIEADLPAKLHLDTSTFWSGVQQAITDFGFDGNADGSASYSTNDIVIAILDTGIDDGHVDLDGGKVLAWTDTSTPAEDQCSTPCDPHGHGTHVSSIAAGEGQGDPNLKGVAPGAALVGVRVLDSGGGGNTTTINNGIQWVIDNKSTYNIRVV